MLLILNPLPSPSQAAATRLPVRARQRLLAGALATPLMLISAGVCAENAHQHEHEPQHEQEIEHRQHGTHVHGIAALNLALDGQEMQLELHSPAANIVGFEHAPASEEQHATLDQAVARLKDGDSLFKFNAAAACHMQAATVTSELLDEAPDHEHEHEHAGETHADITATYRFECGTPEQLTQLSVELFGTFSGMEEIKVQYITERTQGATELTAQDHVVKF
ncbi:DUF2796 domain-containing protein [Rhabdochromatium marinum]|uniref:DUF2796 domain-containing protein n=1 Tax=Rhabdochromatium marinum TaxID=48729 RepID=UPI0019082716|nr:DUF2796 domain-containing protein [Rhabdochromatium marinum]MBK1649250.1 hypothetical protein [Rhabdochromatium marinum]